MTKLEPIMVRDSCEQEGQRASYPEGFPALPPLPAGRYVDPDFYALEMEHVWRKTWLLAGHESECPEPGSYKLFERLGESIIVRRGRDGRFGAFHNVCQHRGSSLVQQKHGRASRFVCPYHAWTYSADGELVKVPEERNFACLDKPALALAPVKCETWRGHIFINMDMDAKPLAEHLGSMPDYCTDFPFEKMALKRFVTIEIDCNWKVAYDNFIEIYHIATVHPAIMRWLEVKTFAITLLKNGHSCALTKRRNGNRIVEDEARAPEGTDDIFRTHSFNLPTFPNFTGGLDAGGYNWQVFWPNGPDKTIVDLPYYGPADVDDETYWDNLETESLRLFEEDRVLLPGVHRAIKTGRLKTIPLSYHERAIYWYQEEIDRLIGAERIDPALRITPVLAPHAAD